MRLGDTYYWLRFISPSTSREWDENALFDLGALGIEEEGPKEEPEGEPIHPDLTAAQDLGLKATFADLQTFKAACNAFEKRAGFSTGTGQVEDWDRTWRERQEPVAVTAKLTVIPPWLEGISAPHLIRLTAKMAFGTGLHESTQLAADLLEGLPPSRLQHASLLDIGAGTGILALYAAQLGVAQAFAHDIDPVCGPCMVENAVLNPLPPENRFLGFVGTTDALKPSASFDILVCNMIRSEWWPFRMELIHRLKTGGVLLISGQRLEDRDLVMPWLQDHGFAALREVNKNGWWAIAAITDILAPSQI